MSAREPHEPRRSSTPDSPARHLMFAVLITLGGLFSVLAASVDPWLLVMMAGVAVTVFAIYDRTDPGWYAL